MKAYYSDRFELPLPAGHRFPMAKYRLLRQEVALRWPDVQLLEPEAVVDEVLELAHTREWVERLSLGRLSPSEERALGFPWSQAMVARSRRSVGATVAACRSALAEGAAVNLAGGTHHAGSARGEGFCCFNDVAVAARLMQAEARVQRVAIVDLDVHQGNGTAEILTADPSVFTLSIHGARNFPFRHRHAGDLDIDLADGTGDEAYLEVLEQALAELDKRFAPELVIYLAGADVYAGDRLGRLSLSLAGVAARDRAVFEWAERKSLPVAVAMGGGYCPRIEEVVTIHAATVGRARLHRMRWRERLT